jgi:hypothetical protein
MRTSNDNATDRVVGMTALYRRDAHDGPRPQRPFQLVCTRVKGAIDRSAVPPALPTGASPLPLDPVHSSLFRRNTDQASPVSASTRTSRAVAHTGPRVQTETPRLMNGNPPGQIFSFLRRETLRRSPGQRSRTPGGTPGLSVQTNSGKFNFCGRRNARPRPGTQDNWRPARPGSLATLQDTPGRGVPHIHKPHIQRIPGNSTSRAFRRSVFGVSIFIRPNLPHRHIRAAPPGLRRWFSPASR